MSELSVKNNEIKQGEWDLTIRPQRSWWDLRLGQLWRYRDLIKLLVRRDFVSYYKQTILGPLWYLIQPIATTIIFTVIFGNIAKLPTDGLPPFLFYLTGTTVWGYFSSCLVSTSNTFTANSGIFGKVYFPRLTIPVSIIISNLISFGIRMIVLVSFLIYYLAAGSNIHPNLWILLVPVLLLIMAGMGLGIGITVSSMTTKYRDFQQLIGFGVQLLMYASPVIYPISTVKGIWRWLILANPMTPVIETFRLAFLGTSSLDPIYLLYSVGFTLLVLFIGVLVFTRVEASFMDTV